MTAAPAAVARAGWTIAGLVAVALGGIGIVVPGLPTTVFFIVAAWCFSRSSPRLEAWVLGLPHVGRLVRDHRAGLGMPRRAKAVALSMLVFFVGLAVVVAESSVVRLVVGLAGLVGVAFIVWRVPTRERVLSGVGAPPAAGPVTE